MVGNPSSHAVWFGYGRAVGSRTGLRQDWSLLVMARLVMARGVDRASRRGAICAKGETFAVFGTGVDVIHPQQNWRLAEQILALLHRPSSNRAPKLVATWERRVGRSPDGSTTCTGSARLP
jgi:DNA recombination-mediator protein A